MHPGLDWIGLRMVAMTDTWSPTSLQLRLVLRGTRNFSNFSPTILLDRNRLEKLGRRLRISCVAQRRGNGIDTRRSWASWSVRDNGEDSMSGWSETDSEWKEESEDSSDSSQRKNWSGGIVGAGVLGILVASGLAFAGISIGKRNTAGAKLEMKPLTAQQEILLHPENQCAEGEEDRIRQKHPKLQNIDMVRETNVNGDTGENESTYDPDSEKTFPPSDSHLVGDTDTSEDSIEQKSLDESAVDEVVVSVDTSLSSQVLPESEVVDASVASRDTDESDTIDALLGGYDKFACESSNDLKEKIFSEFSSIGSPQIAVADEIDDVSLNTGGNEESSFVAVGLSVNSQLEIMEEEQLVPSNEIQKTSLPWEEITEQGKIYQISVEEILSTTGMHNSAQTCSFGTISMAASAYTFENERDKSDYNGISVTLSELPNFSNLFSSAGIPAPTELYEVLRVTPGKVLVNPAIDQVQWQALAALQAMKIIEADVQPEHLCTRREYARWLVTASNALSRNTTSKVYPAMYIENVTDLAFDDITAQDPDFAFIQGLAEAGLISSRLSRREMLSSTDDDSSYFFYPESPLSRQDLVSWKMALEKKELPEANREVLHRLSGFIDVEKIHPDACPAIVADLSTEQGIIALAFGFTKLFQPDKPVTKAQAAVALATGEASDGVSEELTRIEAESMAENAVTAHSALVAQVEKDVHADFENMLSLEREKIDVVEKMAEEAKNELEKLRAKREEDNTAMLKQRASVDSEMEILSRLRREVEEQLESLLSQKFEITYEKERANQLRINTERENQEVARLQYELEVERKALSMARAWAEDEAKRAREHTKSLEEARDRWERRGIKVIVDSDLQEETSADDTLLNAGKNFSVDSTVVRAETLTEKLQSMAATLQGKSKDVIDNIVTRISLLVLNLKQLCLDAKNRAEEVKNTAMVKVNRSAEEFQESAERVSYGVKEGAKRLADDCRGVVEKLSQKFKTA